MVLWARNTETKRIEGFVLNLKQEGVKANKIEGKYALRVVQNADIEFTNAFIPAQDRLEKADDFATGTGVMLMKSRIMVAWAAVGAAIGAYDACIKYISERKQFKRPISGFQISQEKLARMMGNI